MKVNVSLNDDLLTRIDDYADLNYMSRSGFISLACNTYLNQLQAMNSLNDFTSVLKKYVEKSDLDDEALKNIQELKDIASEVFKDNPILKK